MAQYAVDYMDGSVTHTADLHIYTSTQKFINRKESYNIYIQGVPWFTCQALSNEGRCNCKGKNAL